MWLGEDVTVNEPTRAGMRDRDLLILIAAAASLVAPVILTIGPFGTGSVLAGMPIFIGALFLAVSRWNRARVLARDPLDSHLRAKTEAQAAVGFVAAMAIFPALEVLLGEGNALMLMALGWPVVAVLLLQVPPALGINANWILVPMSVLSGTILGLSLGFVAALASGADLGDQALLLVPVGSVLSYAFLGFVFSVIHRGWLALDIWLMGFVLSLSGGIAAGIAIATLIKP